MIISMTGFGTGTARQATMMVSVEIKTVNHRFLDIHIRVPREYPFLEGELQPLVRGALDRGRVDVGVSVQNTSAGAFQINTGLVRGYLSAVEKLRTEFDLRENLDIRSLLTLPGVLQNDETPDAALLTELAKQSVREALEGVLKMRRQEGDALRADMLRHLDAIEKSAHSILALSRNMASEAFGKLRERLTQLLAQSGIDPQRLAQEAAILADKCDISEEIARLGSHINQYRALIEAQEKTGKKLDFLLQEMQREANTILSKSVNLEITDLGLSIKTDVEKLREQVQNVE